MALPQPVSSTPPEELDPTLVVAVREFHAQVEAVAAVAARLFPTETLALVSPLPPPQAQLAARLAADNARARAALAATVETLRQWDAQLQDLAHLVAQAAGTTP